MVRAERISKDTVRLELDTATVARVTAALLISASQDGVPEDFAECLIDVWDALHGVTTYGRMVQDA